MEGKAIGSTINHRLCARSVGGGGIASTIVDVHLSGGGGGKLPVGAGKGKLRGDSHSDEVNSAGADGTRYLQKQGEISSNHALPQSHIDGVQYIVAMHSNEC